MIIEIRIEKDETLDNLTLASAIVNLCNDNEMLEAHKVAKAILVEK